MLSSQMAVSIDNARLYERLKKAEGKYRSIFENAVEGIYQTTIGGRSSAPIRPWQESWAMTHRKT